MESESDTDLDGIKGVNQILIFVDKGSESDTDLDERKG